MIFSNPAFTLCCVCHAVLKGDVVVKQWRM